MKTLSGPSFRILIALYVFLLFSFEIFLVNGPELSESARYTLFKFALMPHVGVIWYAFGFLCLFLNLFLEFLSQSKKLKKISKNQTKPVGKAIEAKIAVQSEKQFFFEEILDLFEGDADQFEVDDVQAYMVMGKKKVIYRHLTRLLAVLFFLVLGATFYFNPPLIETFEKGELAFSEMQVKDISMTQKTVEIVSSGSLKKISMDRPYFSGGKVYHFHGLPNSDVLEAKIRVLNPRDQFQLVSLVKLNEKKSLGKIQIKLLEIAQNQKLAKIKIFQGSWHQEIRLALNKVQGVRGSRYSYVLEEIRPVSTVRVSESSMWTWILVISLGLLTLFFYIQSIGSMLRVLVLWSEDEISIYGFLENSSLHRREFEVLVQEFKDCFEFFDYENLTIKFRNAKVG